MSYLEIRYPDGDRITRELDPGSPLLIGSRAASDVRVTGHGVAPVHCRVSWQAQRWWVAAVGGEGVTVNGERVETAPLSDGDRVGVGGVEIILVDGDAASDDADFSEPEQIDFEYRLADPADDHTALSPPTLRPISSESVPLLPGLPPAYPPPPRAAPRPSIKAPPPPVPPPTPAQPAPPVRPASNPPAAPRGAKSVAAPPAARSKDPARSDDLEIVSRDDLPVDPWDLVDQPAKEPVAPPPPAPRGPRRPGEEDPLQSPVVLGLGAAVLVLTVAAVALWFSHARERTRQQYEVAVAALDNGLLAQGIDALEQFIAQHPLHPATREARERLSMARVDQALSGAAPLWDQGLKRLEALIDQYRDDPRFQPADSSLRKFVARTAGRIAVGSAEHAGRSRQRAGLDISRAATELVESYSPADQKPVETLRQVDEAQRVAEAAIRRSEQLEAGIADIREQLKTGAPLPAIERFRQLELQLGAAGRDKRLDALVSEALAALHARADRDEADESAAPPSPESPRGNRLTLARRTRARSDEASQNETVAALARGSVFACDTVTGEVLWRRPLGVDPAFLPVDVPGTRPGWLLVDRRSFQLLLVDPRGGSLLWGCALGEPLAGPPILSQGQVYVATTGGTVWQIDRESGKGLARVQVPQPLVGPPVFAGDQLIVLGRSGVAYILNTRPLQSARAMYLGHAEGTVAAPAVAVRDRLIVAQNNRGDRARLRMFDLSAPRAIPRLIAEVPVDGLVLSPLVLRGKQLFVPLVPEGVQTLTVSDRDEPQALSAGLPFSRSGAPRVSVSLVAGPDGQLWMAGTAVRRLQLTKDVLKPQGPELAAGLSAQPVQALGTDLFVGRHLPYSQGVLFGKVDRRQMVGQWQVSLGSPVVAASSTSSPGPTMVVNDFGDVFKVSPARLAAGGLLLESAAQLPLPEGIVEPPLFAPLADGRIAVGANAPGSRLILVAPDATLQEFPLDRPLTAPPVLLAQRLLVPLEGRLRLLGAPGDDAPVEDFRVPESGSPAVPWRSVHMVDPRQALALDAAGQVRRLQRRSEPVEHLAEAASRALNVDIAQSAQTLPGRLAILDDAGRLHLLDEATLETRGTLDFTPGARLHSPLGGAELLVSEPGARVTLVRAPSWSPSDGEALEQADEPADDDPELAAAWTCDLEQSDVAGAARVGNAVVIAREDGVVLQVDLRSGAVHSRQNLGERLVGPPRLVAGEWCACTIDGSLVPLAVILASEE